MARAFQDTDERGQSGQQPTTMGGKASARRIERAAAPALSPMALAEAEVWTRAAEADSELLALLDLKEPKAVAGGADLWARARAKRNVRT